MAGVDPNIKTSQDADFIDVSIINDEQLSNPDVVNKIYNRIKSLSSNSNLTPVQSDELNKLATLWFNKIHLKSVDTINKPFKDKHKAQEEIVSSFAI